MIAVLAPKQMKLTDPTAASAAHVHGVAGSQCAVEGTIARDVVGSISDVLSDVMSHVS